MVASRGKQEKTVIHLEKRGWKMGFYTEDIPDRNYVLSVIGDIPGVSGRRGRAAFPAEVRLLELVLAKYPDLDLSEDAQTWLDDRLNEEQTRAQLADREDTELDYTYAETLRPYQRVGSAFVAQAGRSMLCDECGLGKSVQAIAAVEMTPRTETILVVCPNALKLFWKAEIAKWSTLDLPRVVVNSETRNEDFDRYNGGWMIINYAQIYRTDRLKERVWDWVLWDESHNLKNRKTETYKAAQQVKYRRTALITGTPFGNDVSELWAPLHLLEPKYFSSYWRFYEMYVEYYQDYWEHRHILGVRNRSLLRKELASRMIRRKKDEVSDELPSKVYQTIPLEMTALQKKLYRQMADEMILELESGELLEAVNTMSMITRLRQILSTPAAFDFEDSSAKLNHVMELVRKYKKLVVFCQFRAPVKALDHRLTQADVDHVTVLGGMGDEAVDAAVRRFQEDADCRVFVCTAQTGGIGLTLTAARVAVLVSRPWSAIEQSQTEDRVHRISQTEQVQIISLLCPNTVDDLVEKKLANKLRMTQDVLQEALVDSLKPWTT
jgi:SNF2 family DNA or RNA helicase